MKIAVILENEEEEIERADLEVDDDGEDVDDAVTAKIAEWCLAVGYVIRIISLDGDEGGGPVLDVTSTLEQLEREGLVARR